MTINKYFLPDFIEIQRNSFCELLEHGLIEEFSKKNPINNVKKDIELYFYPEYYKLTVPEFNPKKAILNSKSYTSKLYMPVQLSDKNSKIIKLKWAYIGNLPLMTKRGNFIINGAARVIINQIIRSPGIYYQEKFYENPYQKPKTRAEVHYKRYYADLICLKGTWLRLEVDKKKNIWAQTKKGPKIPIFWFLLAMGLTKNIIFQSILEPTRLIRNLNQFHYNISDQKKNTKPRIYSFTKKSARSYKKKMYPYITSTAESWKLIYSLIKGKNPNFDKNLTTLGRKWIFNKFMNPRAYDLGKYGRLAFNKKLGLNISESQRTLTPYDLLYATDYLMKVEKGLKNIDDIDHLKNRRVRTSGQLIQIQIGNAVIRLEKAIREKLRESSKRFDLVNSTLKVPNKKNLSMINKENQFVHEKLKINYLINTKPFNSALREFFGTSPLSQFMDQINPLSDITHKRRLSSMGPGGVTRDTATLAIRGIHPTHYGRICPVETPEGKNTGLVNSITTYARVNFEGVLESPFYKVYKGQVQKNAGMVFLSAEEEEKIKLAASDLFVSSIKFLPRSYVPVRIKEDFTKIRRNDVEYVGVSPIQMVSIATSLIPFLEHDDANRALMGSNMQRQAVPLMRPNRPIVGTGLEARAVSDSGHVIQAKFSGLVTYVSGENIIVTTILNS